MKYTVQWGSTLPSSVAVLKAITTIPTGDTGLLFPVADVANGEGIDGADNLIPSWDVLLANSMANAGNDVFYPTIPTPYFHSGQLLPGYAVQWVNENVTFSIVRNGGGYELAIDITEDINHLAICRVTGATSGFHTFFAPYFGGTIDGQDYLGDASASLFSVQIGGFPTLPVYDAGRNAIAIGFLTIQAHASANYTPTNWGFQVSEISKFVCEFGGVSYDVNVKSATSLGLYGQNMNLDQVYSDILYLPLPIANPSGALRVTAVMNNGFYCPWNHFLLQPFPVLDSPDGVGNAPGNFVTARHSFGSNAAVTRVRWSLGANPQVYTGINTSYIDAANATTKQSFTDNGIYFESDDLNAVFSTAQVIQGPFHPSVKAYPPFSGIFALETGQTGIALACDDSEYVTNNVYSTSWPWNVSQNNYSTIDTLTQIDTYLHPTCPLGLSLAGSGVFSFQSTFDEVANANVNQLQNPICTINGTDFHNYSGWDATTTRDEKWLVLAYNRSLTRWEFHTGYGWEVINLMSVPWDGDEWLLATISILIDATIASIAWKVIYDNDYTPSIPSFEIWFMKSIDGGETWSTAVKANTVTAPFLARAVQSPTTGIMSIGVGSGSVASSSGGDSWA